MAFDFSELKDADLDLESSGSWPASLKIIAYTVVFVLTLLVGYYLMVNDQLTSLEAKEKEEVKLRYEYENKFRLAYNLKAYQDQMVQMEVQLAQMLKKLPATHETPGLIDDITFIATAAGLRISSIRWGDEVEQEFYTELPLYIDVKGDYHQYGKFVSDVAQLPRIVSLHEFKINKDEENKDSKENNGSEGLLFNLVAKTYRYKGK